MKNRVISNVLLCPVLFLASSLAIAEPALLIDSTGCRLLDEDGNVSAITGDRVGVIANSENGNVNWSCTVDLGVPTDSGRAVIWNYDKALSESPLGEVTCSVAGDYVTDDWHEVISSNGKAKLTCHFKSE